jgi:hypothetical protein
MRSVSVSPNVHRVWTTLVASFHARHTGKLQVAASDHAVALVHSDRPDSCVHSGAWTIMVAAVTKQIRMLLLI